MVLVLAGQEVLSLAVPREQLEQNPTLVRRMTDEIVRKVEAGESLADTEGIKVTIGSGPNARNVLIDPEYFEEEDKDLVRRKGGGGHGSGGHGSGSHSSGGSRSSASHPSSHGATYGGGGGAVFGAGAAAGIGAGLLASVAVESILWPGYWSSDRLWVYPFNETFEWNFHNATLGHNETKPVACVCAEYQSCTCKATNDSLFIANVVKNGTFGELNNTQITVADFNINGTVTPTILLNGTVANGTVSTGGAARVLSRSAVLAMAAGVLTAWCNL